MKPSSAAEADGTNLLFLRARYYDSRLQRFASEDPIGFDGGINHYSYVGNNPISYADPLGLARKDCDDELLVELPPDLDVTFGPTARNLFNPDFAAKLAEAIRSLNSLVRMRPLVVPVTA